MSQTKIAKLLLGCLVLVTSASASSLVCVQSEVSRRTELVTGTAVPIQAGTISRRDTSPSQPDVIFVPTVGILGTPFTSEVEIITLGYQIPDFNPDDLYTHFYHFGMFSETGNGSGTAYPDTDGYVEYELNSHAGEKEWRTFLYSTHVETGEARVFIDANNLSVNQAVSILTNVSINARPRTVGYADLANRPAMRGTLHIPREVGNQRRMELHGDYLTLENIQEEIFSQTRCNVEKDGEWYYLESCR